MHLPGTSSLSQAVHAALANVIQDPLITVTGETCVSNQQGLAGGDSTINHSNRCENCSKLRQQLTLLIYEVLNLENTMESKICEYVQRRLSEIAISEQLTSVKTTENLKSIDSTLTNNENIGKNRSLSRISSTIFFALDLSSNSSTCNYTMAQNNNHIVQEGNHSNVRTNKSEQNQSTMKYRAERTLTFENVLIGDSTLKYLDPARFDVERKTYIKTMVN